MPAHNSKMVYLCSNQENVKNTTHYEEDKESLD